MNRKLIRYVFIIVGIGLVAFAALHLFSLLDAEISLPAGGKPTGAFWTDPPYNTYTFTGWMPDGKQIVIHHVSVVWGAFEQDYVIDLDSGMMEKISPDWIGEADLVSTQRNGQSIVITDPEQQTHFPELEVITTSAFGKSRRVYPPIYLESLDCPSQLIRDQFGTVTATFSNSALVEQTFEVSLLAPSLDVEPTKTQTVTIPANSIATVSWEVLPIDTIHWFTNQSTRSREYLTELFQGDLEANRRWSILRSDSPLVRIEPLRYDCYMRVTDRALSSTSARGLSVISALAGSIMIGFSVRPSDLGWLKSYVSKIWFGIAVFIVLVLLLVVLTLLGPAIGNAFPMDRSAYFN